MGDTVVRRFLRRLDQPPLVNRVAFEIWILAASFVSGLSILVADEQPDSIQSALEPAVVMVWAVAMIVGSLVIVYALLAKERLKGLLLEYWTLFPYGASLSLYGLVAILQIGLPALLPGLLSIGAGLACFTTAHLIKKTLDRAGLWKNGLGKFWWRA